MAKLAAEVKALKSSRTQLTRQNMINLSLIGLEAQQY